MLKIELTKFEKEDLIFKLVLLGLMVILPVAVIILVNYAPLWVSKALVALVICAIIFKVFIYDPIITIYRAYKRSNDVR